MSRCQRWACCIHSASLPLSRVPTGLRRVFKSIPAPFVSCGEPQGANTVNKNWIQDKNCWVWSPFILFLPPAPPTTSVKERDSKGQQTWHSKDQNDFWESGHGCGCWMCLKLMSKRRWWLKLVRDGAVKTPALPKGDTWDSVKSKADVAQAVLAQRTCYVGFDTHTY